MDWVGRKKGGLFGFQVWHFPQNFSAGSAGLGMMGAEGGGSGTTGRVDNRSCSLALSGRSFGLLFIVFDPRWSRTYLILVFPSVRSLGLPM